MFQGLAIATLISLGQNGTLRAGGYDVWRKHWNGCSPLLTVLLFPHLSSSSHSRVYLFPCHENPLTRRVYSAINTAFCFLAVVASHVNTCRTREGLVLHQLFPAIWSSQFENKPWGHCSTRIILQLEGRVSANFYPRLPSSNQTSGAVQTLPMYWPGACIFCSIPGFKQHSNSYFMPIVKSSLQQ